MEKKHTQTEGGSLGAAPYPAAVQEPQAVYSFRCPHLMDYYLGHFMDEHIVSRSQVIRLGVYLLASYARWAENEGLSLRELIRSIEARSPESFPDFVDFCRS